VLFGDTDKRDKADVCANSTTIEAADPGFGQRQITELLVFSSIYQSSPRSVTLVPLAGEPIMTDDDIEEGVMPVHSWGGGPRRILITPAKTPYVPRRGDTAYSIGEENHLKFDEGGGSYDPQLFSVPAQRIPFGPLIQSGFVQMPGFNDEDWKSLTAILGVEAIPESTRDLIEVASELYVNSVVLRAQMATWKDLRHHLNKIIPPTRNLVAALTSAKPVAPSSGVLAAAPPIGTHISMELSDPPYGFHRIVADLTKMLAFAESALQTAKTGPGTGAQAELRIFLNTLANVANDLGVRTTLPGHDVFAKVDPSDEVASRERARPTFFRFVREVLRLGNIYGAPGISRTSLVQEEKDSALALLKSYAVKTDKALSKQLERIKSAPPPSPNAPPAPSTQP